MRARLLPLADAGERDIGRWRELAATAAEPNPFFEPELMLATRGLLAESAEVALLVAEEDSDRWAGCVPVRRARRWRRVPVPALTGWRHLYCFLGTPLVAAGSEETVVGAWLDARPSSTFLGLELVSADGPVQRAVEEAAAARRVRPVRFESFERAALRSGPEGLDLGLSKKRGREMRRLRRRLGEELGGEPVTVDRAGDPAAVEGFLKLEAAGWKGRQGTAFASIPGHAEFLRRVCASFAAEGRLQLLSLEVGGYLAAMKCNLRAGDELFCFKIAFDEGLARFSPGVQLERDTADLASEKGEVRLIDTCAEPHNEMANLVWPDRRRLASIALPGRGAAGRVSRVLVRATSAARNIVRR